MLIETSKTEMQREKENEKDRADIQFCGTIRKCVTYMQWEYQKEKKGRSTEIFEEIMTRNFPKLMINTKPQIQKLREHQEE